MNTGIRRFILRLIVGLLTFVIGVAAAMALGGFQPFQGFTNSPNYSYGHTRCRSGLAPDPAIEYGYGEPGCKKRARYRSAEIPPPPPMVDAPLPPEPPRAVR